MATADPTAPNTQSRPCLSALDVPAIICGAVSVVALSAALAHAGLRARYDRSRAALVIEPSNAGRARRALRLVLESLDAPAYALDPLCGHCGGSGFDGDDACRFCDATGRDVRHNT